MAGPALAPPVAAAASRRSSSPINPMDDQSEDTSALLQDLIPKKSMVVLPHCVIEWTNKNVEDHIVVVIWTPSSAFEWWLHLLPGRDSLHLWVCWPCSYNADGLCMHSGFSPKDATVHDCTIKGDIATCTEQEGKLIGENMHIDLLKKANEEQPDVNWKEIRANLADVGDQHSNFRCKVFNRHMIVDLKVPSNGFSKKKNNKAVFLDDANGWASDNEDMEADDCE